MTLREMIDRLLGNTSAPRDDPEEHEEPLDMPADAGTRLVIGLGNPGRKYQDTRHNFGFFVVEEIARRLHAPESRKRFKAEISEGRSDGRRFILAQPQTFMNDSGVSVREIRSWYKASLDQMLIVVDDLDLPFGQIRLRARGSAGGHNGLKSIIALLGSEEIPRLRIGIGRGPHAARAHVLSRFSPEEQSQLDDLVARAADIVELWADRGIVEAMNAANSPNEASAARVGKGSVTA